MAEDDLADRVEFLEAQLMALRGLVMSQAQILETFLPGSAAATAQVAELKRRAAIHNREPVTASGIESLVDELRQRLDLAAND